MATFAIPTPVVIVVDEKVAGTAGGTFISGFWQTRDLNILRVNDAACASLKLNQVTLLAGTYECWASAPGFDVDRHMIRLQNITDTSTIEPGSSESATSGVQSRSMLYSKFSIATPKALEIQHRSAATKATEGFGRSTNLGTVETFAIAMFRKVA